jgi:hypothetical protein
MTIEDQAVKAEDKGVEVLDFDSAEILGSQIPYANITSIRFRPGTLFSVLVLAAENLSSAMVTSRVEICLRVDHDKGVDGVEIIPECINFDEQFDTDSLKNVAVRVSQLHSQNNQYNDAVSHFITMNSQLRLAFDGDDLLAPGLDMSKQEIEIYLHAGKQQISARVRPYAFGDHIEAVLGCSGDWYDVNRQEEQAAEG